MTESPITETRPGQRIPAEEYDLIVDDFLAGVAVRILAEYQGVTVSRIYQILRSQGIQASDYGYAEEPRGLDEVIQRHARPYPADDPRRAWIERAVRQWAGESE